MTIHFWIKESGNGAICSGYLPDGAYDEHTCILVPKRPSEAHIWNNEYKEWEESLELVKANLRAKRDPALSSSDKYMLSDNYDKLTPTEQQKLREYRQALRDAPNHEKREDLKLPKKPAFLA